MYKDVIIITLLTALLCAPLVCLGGDFCREQKHATVVSNERNIVINGVRWGFHGEDLAPRFKRTTIDPTKVVEVYYWSENFPPEWLAAHGMLAFVMEGEDGVVAEDGERDGGIALSVEAHLRKGENYNLVRGLGKHFPLVYQLSTLSDRLQKSLVMAKNRVSSFRLKLTDEQKENLLRNVLEAAAEERKDVLYNTLTNSCVTNACKMINTVVPEKQQLNQWVIPGKLVNMAVSYPKFTYRSLIAKGLVEEQEELVLEDEFIQLSEHKINLRLMDGYHIPRAMLPFSDRLAMYCDYAQALHALERLQELVPVTSPDFFVYQREMYRVGEIVTELENVVLSSLDDEFESKLTFFLEQELPEVRAVTHLQRMVVERINFRLVNGSSNNEELLLGAKEKLS